MQDAGRLVANPYFVHPTRVFARLAERSPVLAFVRVKSAGVVEDDAHGVSKTFAQPTDAMAHRRLARAVERRTLVHREDDCVALGKANNGCASFFLSGIRNDELAAV